ncbi:MAG: alpha/beta hydrolase, partial [Cyanobacteria bacterium J06649_4]
MKISYAHCSRKLSSTFRVLTSTLIFLPAIILPAQGAERIQFFFGPFEPTIYVEDLETFAHTGEIPERLKPVAGRFNDEQLASLRTGLNAQYELSPIPVAQFTYSTLGENLLRKLGQVVQTDNFLSGMKGIRSALILAAADEDQDGLTALNVMRHFPSQTIQIDFSLAQEIATENVQIFRRRDDVIAEIEQFARSQAVGGAMPESREDPRQPGDRTWQIETISFQTPGRRESSLADLYLPNASGEALDTPAGSLSNSESIKEFGRESNKEIPVVVISHGVASTRNTLAYMAEHFASHGYAVVSIEHTETSAENFSRFLWGQGRAPGGRELLLRPQDITAVLDLLSTRQANARQTDSDSALSHLNLASVGVLGQSLGGYTVLAAGGAKIDRTFL